MTQALIRVKLKKKQDLHRVHGVHGDRGDNGPGQKKQKVSHRVHRDHRDQEGRRQVFHTDYTETKASGIPLQ